MSGTFYIIYQYQKDELKFWQSKGKVIRRDSNDVLSEHLHEHIVLDVYVP